MPEGGVPGTEHLSEAEKATVPKGYAFAVGCSVLGEGNGELVLTSLAEGAIYHGRREVTSVCPDVVPAASLGTGKSVRWEADRS
jgi:hypothetical protein